AARRRGWAVGGTRRAVDAGLIEPGAEVSAERWALSPRLAVAVALDGPDELAPLRWAGTIVAVDPDAGAAGPGADAGADLVLACAIDDLLGALGEVSPAVPATGVAP
ncbi:MAG: hypothetical protein ACRDY3_12865, partial [Acidimicrobiales bacterium]